MGSLKMDFLGLRNLTVLSDAVSSMRVNLSLFTVNPTGSFMSEIKSLFGSAAVSL